MARPWSSFRPWLFLLLLLPALQSCLELGVTVTFRTATTGTVEINALAYRLAQGLYLSEGPDKVAFPASQGDWQALIAPVNGFNQAPQLVVTSWEGSEEDLGLRTKTVISFTNARALEGLFAVFKQKLTLLQANDGKWTVTFTPLVPRVTAAAAETRRLWTALWGDVPWVFGFVPPGQARSERRVTLSDLAGDAAPAEWKLTW